MILTLLKCKLHGAIVKLNWFFLLMLVSTLTACGDYQQAAPVDAVEISDNGAN